MENHEGEKVEKALERVRPYLQADGGYVQLLDVTEDGVVRFRLTGASGDCPMAQMIPKAGIERAIMEATPGIKGVESVDFP